MKLINIAVALTVSAALPLVAAQAGEHRHAPKQTREEPKGMQVVAVSPAPGEPGHGWQYFSDRREARAVVISPGGDYYFSRGHGLEKVFESGATR
ncbi:hypothetical protein FSC37_23005 [Piscinibacter aquaticus]|uniref:CzcE family metal-binding protein n=1 Tax=Piscinibacter aquaticus TaxID=392597 RepID=A0A5C6TP81_9BURK|nr:hypothetical protein FSC37_23005 [Piscinibacter aquaticus]